MTPLTPSLLEEFERCLREQGARVVELWQDGVDDGQIAAAEEAIGERLPDEARMWWRWHDGVPASAVTYARHREFGPLHQFLPLDEAVARTLRIRDSRALRQPGAPVWPHGWLEWTDVNAPMVIDCVVPEGAPAPVHDADFGSYELEDVYTPVAASMGDMVRAWIDAIASGGWWWDRDLDRWMRDRSRLSGLTTRVRWF